MDGSEFFQRFEVTDENDEQEKAEKEGAKTHVLGASSVEPGDCDAARADHGKGEILNNHFVGDDLRIGITQPDGEVTVNTDGCYNKERRAADKVCNHVASF